jgi:uncharacterized surface anchored protein
MNDIEDLLKQDIDFNKQMDELDRADLEDSCTFFLKWHGDT